MLRTALSRLREWIAVDDPEERIEGSGEAIVSPQHRRCRDAEQALEELPDDARDENR
ncbi:hypothetical protein NP511_16735 [Natrinema thermotolerans]|uniref:Uncharacterized protein n=1 Tax=Natrinema thermotolerans TaxID=121872 RepID=A0AAF0T1B0_9EURY|nr:hypothetical protein [Natrinema thermotolerans]ELZ10142.1 hypothetical protein C478_14647 [Natrinema thermotolerans DSM 11552]WMT07022.1 hypothetical protein NP511_16735 [Natrinema thermotolerans]